MSVGKKKPPGGRGLVTARRWFACYPASPTERDMRSPPFSEGCRCGIRSGTSGGTDTHRLGFPQPVVAGAVANPANTAPLVETSHREADWAGGHRPSPFSFIGWGLRSSGSSRCNRACGGTLSNRLGRGRRDKNRSDNLFPSRYSFQLYYTAVMVTSQPRIFPAVIFQISK